MRCAGPTTTTTQCAIDPRLEKSHARTSHALHRAHVDLIIKFPMRARQMFLFFLLLLFGDYNNVCKDFFFSVGCKI